MHYYVGVHMKVLNGSATEIVETGVLTKCNTISFLKRLHERENNVCVSVGRTWAELIFHDRECGELF